MTLKKVTAGVLKDGSQVDCWEVLGEGLHWHMCNRSGSVTNSGVGSKSWCLSEHLMPIRPEEDPLEITDFIIKKEEA